MTTTIETVISLMAEKFELNPDAITPEVYLQDLDIDSMEMLDFIFTIEDHFAINVPDVELDINTLQDIVDLINRHMVTEAMA